MPQDVNARQILSSAVDVAGSADSHLLIGDLTTLVARLGIRLDSSDQVNFDVFDGSSWSNTIVIDPDAGLSPLITLNSDLVVADDLTVSSLSGNLDEIVTLAADGTLQASGQTLADLGANATVFSAYDSSGGQTSTGTALTIQYDTINIGGASFSVNASGELTYLLTEAKDFLIIYTVSTQVSAGTSRSTSFAWLELDTGGGFLEVAGTRAFMYNRQTTLGTNTGTNSEILTINPGDVLRIRMNRDNGSDTIQTIANASSITLMATEGRQGPPGPAGADGDITWEGAFSGGTAYLTNQAIEYLGSSYVANQNTLVGEDPVGTPAKWDLMAQKGDTGASGDIEWQGQWSAGTYNENDTVENGGSSYVCTVPSTIEEPSDSASDWDLVAAKGADSTGGLVTKAGFFDGTTGASLKVNGITCVRNSTGNYTVNFDVNEPDALYVVSAQVIEPAATSDDTKAHVVDGSQSVSSFNIVIYEGDNGGTADVFVDRDFYIMVATW